MKTRRIKVNRTCYTRIRKDPYHAHFDQRIEQVVPSMQMSGKWLEKAGFRIDMPVTIEVFKGKLVLKAKSNIKINL